MSTKAKLSKAAKSAKKYGRRYPWEEWFSRDSFTLRKGRDYDCASYIMAVMMRNVAGKEKYNVKLRLSVREMALDVDVVERMT